MARYSLWSMSGESIGIDDTDDLREAVGHARNFEHEIYDNELKMFAYTIREGRFHWNSDWVLAMVERKNKDESESNKD